MLIGWLLDMVNGSENAPKGTHAGEIAARAMQEAATACGRRVDMKRRKGAYGFGPYADEPWSLQAFQKRVYAVRDFYGVELRGTAVENPGWDDFVCGCLGAIARRDHTLLSSHYCTLKFLHSCLLFRVSRL